MRRRRVKVLTITVVVLAVLFTVVDRIAVHFANGEVAELATEKYFGSPSGSDLDVSITGFPFLTQAAGREFDHVTLDADRVLVNSTANRTGDYLDLTDLHIDLYDVSVPSFTARSAEADHATGTVTVPYDDLAKTLGRLGNGEFTVTPAGDDRINVKGDLVDFETGRRTPVDTTGTLRLAGDEFSVVVPGAGKAGATWRAPLPPGIDMTAAHTTKTGIELTLEGHQVGLGATRFTR
ncbi:DUF2993 domain-containing protein [Streptomyces sp. NPDC006186]|uniref:LmeA family phospholipid-binding protein n=1 Tax=Streptomyces sp. NPDC006186 TaxID=3155248 RepID=UPI0033B1119A